MKKYIPLDNLVAEIERRMKLRYDNYKTYNSVSDFIAWEELEYFKEEFLNRIDEVVYFNKLNVDDYKVIARNYLNEYNFEFNKEDLLENFDYKCNGVRDLKRKLKQEILKEVRDSMEIKL